jgi:hypothetical protein
MGVTALPMKSPSRVTFMSPKEAGEEVPAPEEE